jgi:hypothetical protein
VQFDPGYIPWLNWLGSVRELFFKREVEADLRNRTLHQIASRAVFDRFRAWSEKSIRGERCG